MSARTVGCLLALCAWAVGSPARADDMPWYVGLPLADVQLRAPEGGLPEESLDPLLRAVPGALLDPAELRLDLATLFQVGQFAAVEAEVEPWVIFDEEGEPTEAALLSYVVFPAPRVRRVLVEGDSPFAKRHLLDAANLGPGQTFYDDLDDEEAIRAVRRFLAREGYPRSEVTIDVERLADGRLEVTLHVDAGEPDLLERLTFSGDIAHVVPERNHRKLRRWARRAGMQEGRPFTMEAVTRAQQEIRQQLASMKQGPLRASRGWVGARVTPAVIRTQSGSARVSYTIEPGPRLELEVDGLPWRGERKIRGALGIDERLRLTRGWLDEAPDRVEGWLQRQGWLEATATVTLERPDEVSPGTDSTQVLRVDIDKGARHFLKTGTPPGWVGVTFQGNEALSDAELQRVFDQASPDVVRRDFVTPAELEAGLVAARDTYRARGYQEAELSLDHLKMGRRGFRPVAALTSPLRAALSVPPRRRVIPVVTVHEGPLTLLDRIDVEGVADDVDLTAVRARIDALRGTPFSPQQVESVHRQIIEAHRVAGYLEADGRVSVSHALGTAQVARIEVNPGPRVLLRSIVTRGPRFTQPTFIRREVESQLTLGEPLTTGALDRVRSNLYEIGTFRTVNLSLLGEDAQRDLVIDVAERGRWDFELGAGLSTDLGLRTFGRATRRNLWGRAHRLDLVGQVGLVWRSESIRDWVPDVTQPEWRLAVSYTAPRFPSRPQDLILDGLLREVRQQRTWRMARSGGGVALENRLGRRTDLRIGARVETRQLQEVDLGALLESEPWLDRLEDTPPTSWRVQESIAGLLVHDLRNDPVSPTRGLLLSVNAEYAPGLPWDAWRGQQVTSFVKGSARATAHIPVGSLIFRSTLEGGHGISLNGAPIPLEDRFRMGGTGSLRGYRRDSVGPHNRTSRLDVDWPASLAPLIAYSRRDAADRWVPTGGDTSALGIFELLVPLPAIGMTGWDGYALALFTDVGNTWLLGGAGRATSQRPRYSDDVPLLRVGSGVGARVATPVGPLQLDLALNPQAAWSRGGRQALLVDGWEEPRFRAHLTLGALF